MTDQLFQKLEDRTLVLIEEMERLRHENKHLRAEYAKMQRQQENIAEKLQTVLQLMAGEPA